MSTNPSLCSIQQVRRASLHGLDAKDINFESEHAFLRMCVDFFAGCLGGCAGVLVGHPLDTVKVHLQTQDPRNPLYRGTLHCLTKLIKDEGVRSLYRGMSSPLMGISFVNAIVFGIYGNVQRQLTYPESLKSHLLAGSVAGFFQSIVCAPMELAKTRMQLQSEVKFKSSLHCMRHIIRTEGIRGGFRGLSITAARDVPGFASYFVSYEWLMRLPERPNTFYALTAGGLAGICSWLACYPIDVVKTLLQSDGMKGKPIYKNAWDCAVKNYRKDGMPFFFRGLNSTMVRAFPMNAACFYVVSWVLSFTKGTSLDVAVQSAEQLAIDGFSTFDTQLTYYHQQEKNRLENQRKRSFLVKSMRAFDMFHDSICYADFEQLADEFYPEDEAKYYIFEDVRLLLENHLKSLRY